MTNLNKEIAINQVLSEAAYPGLQMILASNPNNILILNLQYEHYNNVYLKLYLMLQKDGNLKKYRNIFYGWSTRYFRLERSYLHYFEAPHVSHFKCI